MEITLGLAHWRTGFSNHCFEFRFSERSSLRSGPGAQTFLEVCVGERLKHNFWRSALAKEVLANLPAKNRI